METTNQQVNVMHDDKASKAHTMASIALGLSVIALGLSGWMVYSMKYAEENKPKTMEEKVDKFFEKQDQEFDKVFDDKEEAK